MGAISNNGLQNRNADIDMESVNSFYNGDRLLSYKDLDGEKPTFYMCVGNRTAGKTFYFKKRLLNRWMKYHEQFGILVRYNYELTNYAASFIQDIGPLYFPGVEVKEGKAIRNAYNELIVDGVVAGFVISLNAANSIKQVSTAFNQVQSLFFDEFQSETGRYCQSELDKFQSLYVSIARGQGEHIRNVPVYMCSNTVSLINPYFLQFGVLERLSTGTKFLRGHGWVLEMTFNEAASQAIRNTGFYRAFSDSGYMSYSTTNEFLLNSNAFIEKAPKGAVAYNRYVLVHGGNNFGVWYYPKEQLYWIRRAYDPQNRYVFAVSPEDHSVQCMYMTIGYKAITQGLAQAFEIGRIRFEDQLCKNAFIMYMACSKSQLYKSEGGI